MTEQLAPPMRLKELAKLLGRSTDRASILRMVRQIRTRELILGEKILRAGRGKTSPLWTTLPVIRECLPEWFDSRAAMERLLREYLDEIEERLDELHGRDDILAAELRELRDKLARK